MIVFSFFSAHPTAILQLHNVELGKHFIFVRSLAYVDCNSYTKMSNGESGESQKKKNGMYVIYVLLFDIDNVMGKWRRSNERSDDGAWNDGPTDDDNTKKK